MRFFEVLQVEIAQKSQILEISLIFSDFSVEFKFSLIYWGVIEKKSEKGSNELELMPPFRGT